MRPERLTTESPIAESSPADQRTEGSHQRMVGHPCECPDRPKVIDSRKHAEHTRRRYRCPRCEARWTTIEMVVAETETGCNTKAMLSAQLGINDDRMDRIKELASQILRLMPNEKLRHPAGKTEDARKEKDQ